MRRLRTVIYHYRCARSRSFHLRSDISWAPNSGRSHPDSRSRNMDGVRHLSFRRPVAGVDASDGGGDGPTPRHLHRYTCVGRRGHLYPRQRINMYFRVTRSRTERKKDGCLLPHARKPSLCRGLRSSDQPNSSKTWTTLDHDPVRTDTPPAGHVPSFRRRGDRGWTLRFVGWTDGGL